MSILFSKNPAILEKYLSRAFVREEKTLHQSGALSKHHLRKTFEVLDHRLPYRRDVDRIIHSKAYVRYTDKTQVVYLMEDDHITQRGLHVQLVSNFARGVGEVLGLNLDLIEAISLGHDVGHPPFGHEGEGYLSDLLKQTTGKIFNHPVQSCRLFSVIEPLNLGLAVYDGFLNHDGGLKSPVLKPVFGKTWDTHVYEISIKEKDPKASVMPGTLEGCLVKISDTISYLGKDLEDAIRLGIIQRKEIPDTPLGKSNKEILSTLAADLIEQSFEKDYIALSEELFDALKELRAFNFQKIYIHPSLKKESAKIKRGYQILFENLLEDHEAKKEKSLLWQRYLHDKPEKYVTESSKEVLAVDFISGMTDQYFVRLLKQMVIPSVIELKS